MKFFAIAALLSFTSASVLKRGEDVVKGGEKWAKSHFSNFLTFGDSYTDENWLNYLLATKNKPAPRGTFFPESFKTAGGGRSWARYVVQYTGSTKKGAWDPSMTLYNYAIKGAVCSQSITPRYLEPLGGLLPDVESIEIPAFLADHGAKRNGTDEPYFQPPLSGSNAVYAMWDGTNDIGNSGFLTDKQVHGKSLADYVECIFRQWDSLYKQGARFMVLLNLAPLELAPMYADALQPAVAATSAWGDEPPANATAVREKMREYTTLLNEIWRTRLPFEVLLNKRYPGANFAIFDVNSLLRDVYNHPHQYLNGTAPLTTTRFSHHCDKNDATKCTDDESPDSYMWYDFLHPSEQTDRVIAREFVSLLQGKGKYATYIGC